MPAGATLIELHNPYLGIDGQGNINLNTFGLAERVQAGNVPGLVGKGIPSKIVITNAPGASSNICNVTFTLEDVLGNTIAAVVNFDLTLSDASTGAGLTATTASGGIAAAASGGTVLGVLTASKAVVFQTNASGIAILAITDTAKTGFYPTASYKGGITVGAQLTTASYHT